MGGDAGATPPHGGAAPLSRSGLDGVLAAPLAVVYKHSPACWLSALAERRVRAFARTHPEITIAVVDVLRQPELSADLAARLGVPHASPQVIVVRRGRAVWDASHMGISEAALAGAVEGATADDSAAP